MNRNFDTPDMRREPDSESTPPRESVRNLQRYLRRLSYVYPDIPPVPIDGFFDTTTADALVAFQRRAGLPATGVADAETWERLYGEYLDVLFGASEPVGLPIFPISPMDYAVKRGDNGFLVSSIQYLLGEISTAYEFPLEVTESGTFDEETEQAVIRMQGLFLLPPTGEVDKRTWNYLVGAYKAEDAAREQT